MRVIYFLVAILMVAPVFAHGENLTVWQELNLYDPVSIVLAAAGIAAIFILDAIFMRQKATEKWKEVSFVMIAVPIMVATMYLAGTTIYLNQVSVTGGPVHWHADYEVWACGQKYELMDPQGFDNRVGSPLFHEHNDNRLHVEGVILDVEDVNLGEFFEFVGGEFMKDSITFPTNEGLRTWNNGELCNNQPARWYMFVNGVLNSEMDEYILAPYSDVPPGDVIKLVFSEKSPDQINTRLFEVP